MPDGTAAPDATGEGDGRRATLREAAMLWAMRGAMLAYGLVMVVAAEATIAALRDLF